MQTFNVGDHVKWTSQSGGVTRTKDGIVVAVVPGGKHPVQIRVRQESGRAFNWANLLGTENERRHIAYLVAVGNKLYWPRVKHLQKLEPIA